MKVDVSDSYAYIADWVDGLRIIDVSDPSTPSEVSFCCIGSDVYDVSVSGSIAYVANHGEGLRILDVSTPSTPTEIGFYDPVGNVYNVYVSGSYAFIANFLNGFRIIDVSSPSSPLEVGYYDVDDSVKSIFISDSFAYVAFLDSGLYILDVSHFTIFSNIIERGWNLVSIPSTVPEVAGSFGSSIFGYDNTTSDYFAPDSILGKKGYWVLGTDTDTIAVGNGLSSYSDTLYRGWNLIGAVDHPIPSHDITTDPPGLLVPPLFGWDGADYFIADTLYPGRGYWFLSSENGRIEVGP